MTNLRVLGAVVIVASAVSSPALAQAVFSNPAACASQFASANCLNRGAGSPYDSNGRRYYQRRTAYREPVGPVGAAAGVAGAAVGTAAAIATAPFGGWRNSYAAYDGSYDRPAAYGDYYAWNGDWNAYAAHNGIVCKPGTYYKGSDGLRHICQ